jgi:hypothetical protein
MKTLLWETLEVAMNPFHLSAGSQSEDKQPKTAQQFEFAPNFRQKPFKFKVPRLTLSLSHVLPSSVLLKDDSSRVNPCADRSYLCCFVSLAIENPPL